MAITKAKSIETKNKDVSTFLSDLNSAIDFRSSSKKARRKTINHFCYTIGKQKFLLEHDLKAENIPNRTINSVPHLQDWHEGIISVRGTIMPVISLHKFLQDKLDLGSKPKNTNEAYFLMLDHKDHTPIVLLIDQLPETVNIKEYKKNTAPKESPSWFKETLENADNKIIKVNHKKLLNLLISSQKIKIKGTRHVK